VNAGGGSWSYNANEAFLTLTMPDIYQVTATTAAICPDLLCYEQIGEADNWRGRVVRAFFWIMRAWPT
jgi:hypothetical protein